MSESQIRALLVRDPWRLTLGQIDDLNDWEVINVYFRPGETEQAERGIYWPVADKERPVLPWQAKREKPPATVWVSFGEMFKGRLRDCKLFTEAQIEARWQAYLERNPGVSQIEG